MIYFYCPKLSLGVMRLAEELGATRLKRFDGIDFWKKGKRVDIAPGSHVICWGGSLANLEGVKVLNGCENSLDRLREYQVLAKVGVPTMSAVTPSAGYSTRKYTESGYMPRTFKGGELLYPVTSPDYYVQKVTLVEEVVIHSFEGRSIRAGIRVPIEGYQVTTAKDWKPDSGLSHPWIRSDAGGWRTNYESYHSSPEVRGWAHSAVKALGLDFGVVTVGTTNFGGNVVVSVDTGPNLEGKTIDTYVRAINRWIKGKEAVNMVNMVNMVNIPENVGEF